MNIPGLKDVVIEKIEEVGNEPHFMFHFLKNHINALAAVK